jgi:predicted metalloprotease
MRLDDEDVSNNVEDRRDDNYQSGGGGFGLPGLSFGSGGLGLGSIAIAFAASYFLGINPLTVLGLLEQQSPPPAQQRPAHAPPSQDQMAKFVGKVLHTTERTWTEILAQQGIRYPAPKLVLFAGAVPTACGTGQSATGPFYCPGDQKVYIDLRFYELLRTRFQAPGDFAQAYVIAHEVGHHVQNVLGTSAQVERARRRAGEAQANALSVKLELQADCYAGVWAHYNETRLEPGDIEEAIQAATAVGDDTLQMQAQGHVVPESFTHGSAAQRVHWFKQGMARGNLDDCNTFRAAS